MTRKFSALVICTLALAMLVPLSAAGAETVLYSFKSGNDGTQAYAGLIEDSAGNFYGTTVYGGADFVGIVFKLAPDGTETVLHTFTGGSDGANPIAGLIIDKAGNLYGTTYYGGAHNFGTVFKIAPNGTETVLYSFKGGFGTPLDGISPAAGVIMDNQGNLYGTTQSGGSALNGTVFKLTPAGVETVLYSFLGPQGKTFDGANPNAGLIMDSIGNLYGTTSFGGTGGQNQAYGTVFKLTPKGKETILHSFNGGADGGYLLAGLITDNAGNFYSTAAVGGAYNGGVVFKITPKGKVTVLYSFKGGSDGDFPGAGLIADSAGNLYGTTEGGGQTPCGGGCGIVFSLTRHGVEKVLYAFTDGNDGAVPLAGLIADNKGNLFGTTQGGGANSYGVIFEIAK